MLYNKRKCPICHNKNLNKLLINQWSIKNDRSNYESW